MSESEKPRIHISAMTMAERCGVAYHRRHILGERRPPGISLHVGQATHKAGEKDLISKVGTGHLLSEEEICDIAHDKFNADCEEYGLALDDDEVKLGLKAVKGQSVDLAVTLSKLYHKELSPIINPISTKHIERAWTLDAPGYPFDLGGKIDVQEKGVIRDTKTSGKTPSQSDIDNSEQYTMYAMAITALDGHTPKITQDSLVKLKTPKVDIKHTARSQDDFRALMARLSRFAECIEKGIFLPARRDDWWCSLKWCGFAPTCPFFNGQVKYIMGGSK